MNIDLTFPTFSSCCQFIDDIIPIAYGWTDGAGDEYCWYEGWYSNKQQVDSFKCPIGLIGDDCPDIICTTTPCLIPQIKVMPYYIKACRKPPYSKGSIIIIILYFLRHEKTLQAYNSFHFLKNLKLNYFLMKLMSMIPIYTESEE